MSKKYFMDSDNDGHWFIIEVDKRKEWNEWTSLDGDNPDSWEPPSFAFPVNGCPTRVEFTNPNIQDL